MTAPRLDAVQSSVFFGYPSRPAVSRQTLSEAAERLDRLPDVCVTSWEALRTTGQIVVQKILEAIAAADLSVFDITALNENVLFEVGFAVGAQRPLWLVRDETDAQAARRWDQIGIVTEIGYKAFVNSDDIHGPLVRDRPDLSHPPVFEDLESMAEPRSQVASLLYVPGIHSSNPERNLAMRIDSEERSGIEVVRAIARESAVEPLAWYAEQCARADVVVVHLSPENRDAAAVHNARCGFVAGLARGMDRPILMMAESGYKTPFDYHDLLYRYTDARDCSDRASAWLVRHLKRAHTELDKRADYAVEKRRSSELATLRLGEHVAENERGQLAEYFVDTALYESVLRGGSRLFVGRKGTGKTALLIRATKQLEADRRVLTCSIEPTAYDLGGFNRVLSRLGTDLDNRDFIIEGLWKYLLYSQMALGLIDEIRKRPAGIEPGTPEWELDAYLRGEGASFSSDFGVRIESALETLEGVSLSGGVVEDREKVMGALHGELIGDLRRKIAGCLGTRSRVAILADNLDASWDSAADLSGPADLLLGLVNVSQRMSHELERERPARRPTEISVAVFLRSDIFEVLRSRAREADKLPVERIEWADEQALVHVVGERYLASVGDANARPQELWEKYFAADVGSRSASAYIAQRVVPRPRDIIYWCNAALGVARRRGHSKVSADDIFESESVYSQYAVESLEAELGSLSGRFKEVIQAFIGQEDRLTTDEVDERLAQARVGEEARETIVRALTGFTFLGVDRDGGIEYAGDLHQADRLVALAKASARKDASARVYRVHPAFHRYLGMHAPSEGQTTLV